MREASVGRLTELISLAETRGQGAGTAYRGLLYPAEAAEILALAPGARLVDVRSRAELELVGSIPGALHVEWQSYPGWVANPFFLAQLSQQTDREALLLFMCRSGHRSHHAAAAAQQYGFLQCFNVLEGFEGGVDKATGRRTLGSWKNAGLPWRQD